MSEDTFQPSQYVGDDVWNNIDLSPDVSQTSDHTSECSYNDAGDITLADIADDNAELAKAEMMPSGPENSVELFASNHGKRKASSTSPSPRLRRRVSYEHQRSSASLMSASPVIIASHQQIQQCMLRRRVPYGAQYEIWRLVSNQHISPEHISMEMLDKLAAKRTSAEATSAVATVLGLTSEVEDSKSYLAAYAKEVNAKSPWAEFDWEEEAMQKDQYACLGLSDDGCYGGKIILGGKLDDSTSSIKLDRAELGSSSRFLRRFGSRQFLRIKIPRKCTIKGGDLVHFFLRPFVLGSEVFRAFYAKEDNVFLFSCNEIWNGLHIKPAQSQDFSLMDFILWHNPLEVNKSQTMTKWAARFALGLSNSAPGCWLQPKNIVACSDLDVCSSEGSDMTDGAGFINLAGLHQLYHKFGWSRMPTAIQCRAGAGSFDDRLGDAKGLLILDIHDQLLEPRIQLRPSQVKIKHAASSCHDPSWQVIDVLRASHSHSPSRLSTETIINLAENGVPAQAFINLLKASLKATIDPLLQWDGPDAMLDLWSAVAQVGGVMAARLAREKRGEARLQGYSNGEVDLEMDDEDGLHQFDYAIQQRSTAWWADPISGCPSSLEETVMYLLEAGFTPQKLPVLKEKLEKVIKPAIKRHIQSYRIDVPMSLTAFIIPDPFGILQPGEVYFKASHQNLASPSGIDTDLVLGDVLVTRHPCKLPTDTQKWKAVNYPRLSHLVDVIILPILGSRRAADLLAGGDYDGDKALLIWQPEVVEHFINASLHFSIEPPEVKAAFFKEKKTVTDFLEETRASSPEETQLKLQQYLLGALNQPSLVGQYSNFHLNSIYVNGYQHPETIRLAYMFCKVLDSSKSGEQVLSAQVKHDSKLYNKRPPFWKETEEERSHHQTNEINLIRPKEFHGNEFIMDTIYNQAKEEGRLVQQRIEQAFAALPKEHVVDLDLQQPWKQAEALGKQMTSRGYAERAEDLEKIKRHVETMYGEHRKQVKPKKEGEDFTGIPIEARQDTLRSLSRQFASFPSSADLPSFVAAEQPTTSIFSNEEVALIKASYAYIFDHQENSARKGWTRFPWDVAMRDLCHIKARALGPHKTISEDFHARFQVKKARR
ncbi:hypothetical protein BDN71DRAFT_1589707 [Pleurotus eryngii]|uniref:RNA-dependent RNA polymerase n=1 Tax=Pleurotus eryngii TaxID=5323 RepID=A0A9P5ZYE1_PLEER|nr:hypothetical protein BDN71DRAFT_1589707 [Pleurotus eryngii]